MKRVWSGSSLPDTAHFKNLLEHSGIACVIKNRELGGGLGDLPVFDCAPEIWVLDDEHAEPRRAADPRQRAAGRTRRAVALLSVRRRQRAAVRRVLELRPRATAAAGSRPSMRWLDRLLVLCAAVVVVASLLPLGARLQLDARAHDAFQSCNTSPSRPSLLAAARAAPPVGRVCRARGGRRRERGARCCRTCRCAFAGRRALPASAAQGVDGQRVVPPVLAAPAARDRARGGSRRRRRARADAARRERARGLRHRLPAPPQVSGRRALRHRRLVALRARVGTKRSRSAACRRSKRACAGRRAAFTVIGVHLSAPTSPRRAAARNQELSELAARSAAS